MRVCGVLLLFLHVVGGFSVVTRSRALRAGDRCAVAVDKRPAHTTLPLRVDSPSGSALDHRNRDNRCAVAPRRYHFAFEVCLCVLFGWRAACAAFAFFSTRRMSRSMCGARSAKHGRARALALVTSARFADASRVGRAVRMVEPCAVLHVAVLMLRCPGHYPLRARS